IADLKDILARPERIDTIIYRELLEIQRRFGDPRRTELLVGEELSLEDEDLIEEEDVMIVLTHNGYVKRLPATEFKIQNRGGRGIQGMGDRKSTRLNSSHVSISYAVFCLKKKKL